MNFKYDTVADAVYFKVNDGKIKKTIEVGDSVVLDLGNKKTIIGIEILKFSRQTKQKIKDLVKNGVPMRIAAKTPAFA